MKYVVIHTQNKSVECVLGCETREQAVMKAYEIAVRSGFYNFTTNKSVSPKEAMDNAKIELDEDGMTDGWYGLENQRVTVKRLFQA